MPKGKKGASPAKGAKGEEKGEADKSKTAGSTGPGAEQAAATDKKPTAAPAAPTGTPAPTPAPAPVPAAEPSTEKKPEETKEKSVKPAEDSKPVSTEDASKPPAKTEVKAIEKEVKVPEKEVKVVPEPTPVKPVETAVPEKVATSEEKENKEKTEKTTTEPKSQTVASKPEPEKQDKPKPAKTEVKVIEKEVTVVPEAIPVKPVEACIAVPVKVETIEEKENADVDKTPEQAQYQGEMAGKGGARGVQNCMRFIEDEQRVHQTSEYGENKKSVNDALDEQHKRNTLVGDYKPQVDAAARGQKREDADSLKLAYDGLSTVSNKRLGCLEDISQIASLEDMFGALSVEFAQRATTLVANEVQKTTDVPDKDGEGVACAAQNCVLAVRRNWAWISKLVRCADIHLQHVTDYHQFFHEVTEYTQWMTIELNRAQEKLGQRPQGPGDQKEAEQLLVELKELLTLFLHWQHKLDDLFERSRKVVPVHLRTQKLDYFRPATSLCDYKTKEIFLREGEEVTLKDNSQAQSWTVRTLQNVETNVPSVVLVIPGPDPAAVEAATRLRLQLLGLWTLNIKRIGKTLIYFMVLVVKDWDQNEGRWIKSMTDSQKADVRQVLAYISTVLGPYWSQYPGYKELDRRVQGTMTLLSQPGRSADRNEQASGALVNKLHTVEELLKSFSELWRHWDSWRLLVDTSRHPDYLLMIDGWERLKFMEIEKLRELWQKGLDFDSEDMEEWYKLVRTLIESYGSGSSTTHTGQMDSVDGGMSECVEELITTTEAELVTSGMEQNGMTSLEARKETAETGQILHAEQEEKKTFVITGVLDPRSGEEVSMQDAVLLGIINSNNGTYNNPDTGESMPIPVAMNAGKIKVEFTKTRKTAEKRRDVGLITITTEQESRPYTVKGVIDAKTDKQMSVEDAVAAGILDQNNGIYKNTLTESEMSMADALDSGLLVVEFEKDVHVTEPEVVVRTYAIHAIVDQRKKQKVSFTDAVRMGLLDKDTGAYWHNINREHVYVGDAIKRGFIKATVVKDASKLDIDPENKMVVDKLQTIKKKLITPMVAMSALRKAAQNGVNGNGK